MPVNVCVPLIVNVPELALALNTPAPAMLLSCCEEVLAQVKLAPLATVSAPAYALPPLSLPVPLTVKLPALTVIAPLMVLFPVSVNEPVPAFVNASVVGPLDAPEFLITPLKVPEPLSLPTDSVNDLPPAPSAKSTVPLPVSAPILIVSPR